MLERTITLNGFSKGFAMTGWRLGYAAAPVHIAVAMARMQSIISAGANAFVQRAAVVALNGPRNEVLVMREIYRHRRDMVIAALRQLKGVMIPDIPATFYAFPDVSALLGRTIGYHSIATVEELCDWLLDVHGVATVPGSAFGNPSALRLSFATNEEGLKKGLERIAEGVRQLQS